MLASLKRLLGSSAAQGEAIDYLWLRSLLRDILGAPALPVVWGVPVGHGVQARPLVLGSAATLDLARGTLTVASPALIQGEDAHACSERSLT